MSLGFHSHVGHELVEKKLCLYVQISNNMCEEQEVALKTLVLEQITINPSMMSTSTNVRS